MKTILYIRIQQFRMFLKKTEGGWRGFPLILIMMYLLALSQIIGGNSWVFLPIYLLLIMIIHFKRSDHRLLSITRTPVYRIYLLEYLALGTPFFLAGTVHEDYLITTLTALLGVSVAFLPGLAPGRHGK